MQTNTLDLLQTKRSLFNTHGRPFWSMPKPAPALRTAARLQGRLLRISLGAGLTAAALELLFSDKRLY